MDPRHDRAASAPSLDEEKKLGKIVSQPRYTLEEMYEMIRARIRLVPRACTQVRACDYAVLFENWSSSQRDKFVVKQARTSSGPLRFHALFDCASLCHKITR